MWRVSSDFGEDSYIVEGFEPIEGTRQLRSVGRAVKRVTYMPEDIASDYETRHSFRVSYAKEVPEIVFGDSDVLEKIPEGEVPGWAKRNLEQAKLLSMAIREKA